VEQSRTACQSRAKAPLNTTFAAARRLTEFSLVADEFGNEVTNDPQFVQVIDDVIEIIERDEGASAMFRCAFEQITSPDAD
jgi:hypothetical protein